ncbi:MAG: hypothetical protein ACLT50_00895 [Mediterraneibacter faecis]
MNIKDLLENFNGNDTWVEIKDEYLYKSNAWRKGMAIEKYGYCPVISWAVKDNNIIINTRSQF